MRYAGRMEETHELIVSTDSDDEKTLKVYATTHYRAWWTKCERLGGKLVDSGRLAGQKTDWWREYTLPANMLSLRPTRKRRPLTPEQKKQAMASLQKAKSVRATQLEQARNDIGSEKGI